MKKKIHELKLYLQRIYRLSIKINKHEEIVWNHLKKVHAENDWKSGIYEKEKFIETFFKTDNTKSFAFSYFIFDSGFHCMSKVIENFPTEITTDLFILASHFNNILNNGVVKVNVNNQCVEYHINSDLLINLLYPGEINRQIERHFSTSKDVFYAFQRLIVKQEAPAIIIADLLKSKEVNN